MESMTCGPEASKSWPGNQPWAALLLIQQLECVYVLQECEGSCYILSEFIFKPTFKILISP